MKILSGKSLITKNIWLIVGFVFLFLIILTNQIHQPYPDEFENILGGWFILHGRLPYIGFFTHHNPFAYFFAAPIVFLSGPSFVKFRIILGVFYLSGFVAFYLYIKNKWGAYATRIVKWLIIFLVFSATYTWGHMLLGDTLSAYLLLASYIIIVFIALSKEKLTWKMLWIISILTAFAFLTSAALLIACGVIYLFVVYLFIRQEGFDLRKLTKLVVIFATPYLIFLLYLVITGSLTEYYFQAIRYTTDIYAKLPGGFTSKNPIRILIIYFHEFMKNYKAILSMIKDLNYANPFPHALALSNIVFIVYLLLNKKYATSLFVFFIMVYASLRGNPYTTSETDYQAIQYQFVSMFNGIAVLLYIWNDLLKNKIKLPKKVFYSFFLIYLKPISYLVQSPAEWKKEQAI